MMTIELERKVVLKIKLTFQEKFVMHSDYARPLGKEVSLIVWLVFFFLIYIYIYMRACVCLIIDIYEKLK